MAGTLSPTPWFQFLDNNGLPAAGYKLFTYQSGTTTKANTWTDSALSVLNTNPIILDAAGRCTIYLSAASFKYVLASPTDTDPPTSPIKTQDNISAVPLSSIYLDVTGLLGDDVVLGDWVYLSDGSGGKTAGTWYKTDATNAYSSMTPRLAVATATIATGASGSLRLEGQLTGLVGLTAGSTYYLSAATAGAITLTAPTNSRIVAVADTTTSLMIHPRPGTQFELPPTFRPNGWSTYGAKVGGRIYAYATNVGNVGAGEDTIFTYTLPGGTLNMDLMGVKLTAWGTTTNNANAKKLRAYFGGQLLSSLDCATNEQGSWICVAEITRTGAATQRAYCGLNCGPVNAMITASSGFHTAPAETLSGDVVIKITGEATTDNDLVTSVGIVRLEP